MSNVNLGHGTATAQGITIAGTIGSDALLMKLNVANGDTLWTRRFGGSQSDEGRFVEQTEDGGFIMVGATSSYGAGAEDIFVVKTDRRGNTRRLVRRLD